MNLMNAREKLWIARVSRPDGPRSFLSAMSKRRNAPMRDPDTPMRVPDAMVKRPIAMMSFIISTMRLMNPLVKHRNAFSASRGATGPSPICVTRA